MKRTLFNLDIETYNAEDEKVAEVTIDGFIGEDFFDESDNTKQAMRNQLKQIDSIKADRIIVNISSLGGDVDHGLAIHDLLASHPSTVETNVIGMTASAATIIAQAGNVRKMSDNALYLVHKAWTIGMGNANDFEALVGDLRKLDDRIANIYSKRSGFDRDDFISLMNESNGDGIWISADEAKDYGLIDEITEPMKAAAYSMRDFQRAGIKAPQRFKGVVNDESSTAQTININFTTATGTPEDWAVDTTDEDINVRFVPRDEVPEGIEEEDQEDQNVSAMSRERATLELLKIKYKTNE